MLWIFLLEVPTGAVADRIGRKHSLALGSFILTFGALIYGSIPKFEIFLLGEFLFAASFALTSGADKALMYDSLKEAGREEESRKIFGKANSAKLLGIGLSAPIGSVIASNFGLNAPLLLAAVPFALSCLIAWSIKEPKIHEEVSESKRYIEIAKKGFLFFYKHTILRKLAFDAVLVSTAAYFVIWLYQPLLISIDFPVYYFGFIFTALTCVEILISANFTRLEKLFGSAKNYLRFSAIITAVSFLVVAVFPNLITIILFIIFAGGFGYTRRELMIAYMNKYIPSEQRATVLSSISMFGRAFLIILNPLIGFTADHSLRIALIIVGIIPLVVFLFSPLEQEMLED